MNLFIVPSWYPSKSNPSYGIFIREQVSMMAREKKEWTIGVSRWGQGADEKLIWAKDHIRNFKKISSHGLDKADMISEDEFIEYYQPALSWTKKFRKGNLEEIIRANELNYQRYTLENGKPDVIMVQACYPGILIADYLSRKYDVPVHQHIRLGGFMFEKMLNDLGAMKSKLLATLDQASLVTTTSDFQKGELQKWVQNTRTIYNPVDLDFFQIDGNKADDYALSIGRLEDEKGFDLLIEAISLVPHLRVKIVGSGSEEIKLKKRINALELGDRVSLIGEMNREEVKMLIQKCQFLILPSKYETFGNVLLEAMACGKPVVATKCGGPEEIVLPESGYLSERNAKDLAEGILQMTQEYPVFEANSIRKSIQDRFSPQQWIANLEGLLMESL
ncbi:MAG: glycosyltransferase [Ekhidna sp.]